MAISNACKLVNRVCVDSNMFVSVCVTAVMHSWASVFFPRTLALRRPIRTLNGALGMTREWCCSSNPRSRRCFKAGNAKSSNACCLDDASSVPRAIEQILPTDSRGRESSSLERYASEPIEREHWPNK